MKGLPPPVGALAELSNVGCEHSIQSVQFWLD